MTDMKTKTNVEKTQTRRELLKKGAYAAPAILTLSAMPAFAGSGSPRRRWHDDSDSWDSDSDSDSDSK